MIQEIDLIQNHGVGAADINKLKAAGYFTIAVSLAKSIYSYPATDFNHSIVYSLSNSQKPRENQRIQWAEGWEG